MPRRCNRINLYHNGYDIQFLNNEAEVEKYIQSVIEPHMNLGPRVIYDKTIRGEDGTNLIKTRIIRYRYDTLYEEDFFIDYLE